MFSLAAFIFFSCWESIFSNKKCAWCGKVVRIHTDVHVFNRDGTFCTIDCSNLYFKSKSIQ